MVVECLAKKHKAPKCAGPEYVYDRYTLYWKSQSHEAVIDIEMIKVFEIDITIVWH